MSTNDIFFSHASENFNTVDRYRRYLNDEGINCWMAPNSIPPGKSFLQAITEAILNSKVLLVFLSKESYRSPFVEAEVRTAFENRIPIIPCFIEKVIPKDCPFYFLIAEIHYLELLNNNQNKSNEILFETVIRVLGTTPQKIIPKTIEIIPAEKFNLLLDLKTYLIWLVKDKLVSTGSKPYRNAEGDRDYFNLHKVGGFLDWRLPTVEDCETLNRIVDGKPISKLVAFTENIPPSAWTDIKVEPDKAYLYDFKESKGKVISRTSHSGTSYLVRSIFNFNPREEFQKFEGLLEGVNDNKNTTFGKPENEIFIEATKALSLKLPRYISEFTREVFVQLLDNLEEKYRKELVEFVATSYNFKFKNDGTNDGFAALGWGGAMTVSKMEADFPGITKGSYKKVQELFGGLQADPDPNMQDLILYSLWKKCGKI